MKNGKLFKIAVFLLFTGIFIFWAFVFAPTKIKIVFLAIAIYLFILPGVGILIFDEIKKDKNRKYETEEGKPLHPWIGFLLCLFFGIFGAHKFYEKRIAIGVVYILTYGLFGIGWLTDLFLLLPRLLSVSNSPKIKQNTGAQTIYFKNGKMYKVYPTDKESWYDARYLVSDGKTYDLENINDIKRIPTPNFNKLDNMMEGYGVTGSLDYVIRMKAGNARKKGLIEESDELYRKAIALMQESGIGYDIKPYLYFAKDLLKEGRFEESEREEKRAYAIFEKRNKEIAYPHETLSQKLFFDTLNDCKKFKIDYIEMMWHNGTCEKCAIYHGRLYCISGKDKRFPKLPEFIIKNGGQIHPGCRHIFRCIDPEIYETIPFRDGNADIFTVSNRPFIDDRTDDEKKAREITLSEIEKRNRPYITDIEKEFYHIKYAIPELAPKSLSGYTRMKNQRTENFMKLVDAAKEKGINIEV